MPWIPNRVSRMALPAASSCMDSCSLPVCTIRRNLHVVPTLWASIAQLVEHALRKRMVVGSIPTGGSHCKVMGSTPMMGAWANLPGDAEGGR